MSFQFFISSDVLLYSFHFTLLYLCLFHVLPLSFHARYFHVLPLSVYILSLSLHAMSKSSQIEYSECMTLATMVVTIYMCEYWEKTKYTLIQKHFLSCSHSFHAFHSPVSFLSVSFHFLPCSFYFRQSYLCFTFTLFNFPPFLLFFHVLLMFLWFPFPFVSFSFSSSFHVPFIYSLVTSVSFPFSFKSFHFSCMSCHFSKSYRISVHICFKLCSWSLVLFMIFLARLCIGVPIHNVIMRSSFKAV